MNKKQIIRLALAVAMVALVSLILPKADHQSYSYELNQPWKYPLLTAQFDMPVMRDSMSAKVMRDSIDRNFIPFVKRDNNVAEYNEKRFATALRSLTTPKEASILQEALAHVYKQGIVTDSLYSFLTRQNNPMLRLADNGEAQNIMSNVPAGDMKSASQALHLIDSIYKSTGGAGEVPAMAAGVTNAIKVCLQPNIVLDSVTDSKYRNQEYLNVTGALGIIKKGQRIVDRGEIVNAQIYTNLNTYTEMLDKQKDQEGPDTYFLLGQILYVTLIVAVLYVFLALYRSRFFSDLRKMTFLMTFITLFVIFAIVMFEYVANGIYLVPFAAVPLVTMIFFDSRTAIFALISTVLIAALVSTYPFQFIFLQLMAGLVATFSIRQLSQRSQLLRTALFTFLCYLVCYGISIMIEQGTLESYSWKMVLLFGINSVILSFAYILVVLVEKIFGFTSTVTLIELSDINQPLLRQLAEDAPGTFQHSMQVSTLAAEAARAIDANTQLVRTGALYHDIGKMESPVFFTENQHGINPHEGLDPETSAKKIIGHVTGGLAMAQKAKLPQVIRDFIAEHHGKGLTRYFYNTAVNANGQENVDITHYQYPGPNPQSKETAILMMADAVEAASRSLKDYSTQSISNLVDKIIQGQINDGLFNESNLSFRDLETVKNTFKKRLATIYHSRVEYPELKKQAKEEE